MSDLGVCSTIWSSGGALIGVVKTSSIFGTIGDANDAAAGGDIVGKFTSTASFNEVCSSENWSFHTASDDFVQSLPFGIALLRDTEDEPYMHQRTFIKKNKQISNKILTHWYIFEINDSKHNYLLLILIWLSGRTRLSTKAFKSVRESISKAFYLLPQSGCKILQFNLLAICTKGRPLHVV